MSTHDVNGRPYAKLSELKAGDVLDTDGDFTCIGKGEKVLIKSAGEGHKSSDLYFMCDEGRHYLAGQVEDDGEHLIGLYKPESINAVG